MLDFIVDESTYEQIAKKSPYDLINIKGSVFPRNQIKFMQFFEQKPKEPLIFVCGTCQSRYSENENCLKCEQENERKYQNSELKKLIDQGMTVKEAVKILSDRLAM
jgi:hypothetical protein